MLRKAKANVFNVLPSVLTRGQAMKRTTVVQVVIDEDLQDILEALAHGVNPDNNLVASYLRSGMYPVPPELRNYLADLLEGKITVKRGRPPIDPTTRIFRDINIKRLYNEVYQERLQVPRAKR